MEANVANVGVMAALHVTCRKQPAVGSRGGQLAVRNASSMAHVALRAESLC